MYQSLKEIRLRNLLALISKANSQVEFAEKVDIDPSYLSQIKNPNNPKQLGEKLCRKIEQKMRLENGWMDVQHPVISQAVNEDKAKYNVQNGVDLVASKDVPIVGTAEGGPDGHWDELGHPVGHGSEVVEAYSKDQNAYALLVSGNSMSPRMRPGEAILVEPNQAPQPGDEVVLRTVDDQVMVKIFTKQQGDRYIFDSVADSHNQIMVNQTDIVFMHYVAGVFRTGSIKQKP